MSIEVDVQIGKTFYGWTDEKTETNKWYDPWAKVWRPVPDKTGATPAFSTSIVHTIQFMEHLDWLNVQVHIFFDGSYTVILDTGDITAEYRGSELAPTLCNCAMLLAKDAKSHEENYINEDLFKLAALSNV